MGISDLLEGKNLTHRQMGINHDRVDSARHDRLRRAVAVHVVDVADPIRRAGPRTQLPFVSRCLGRMVRDSDTHGGEEIDRRLADGWKGCSQRISRRRRLAANPGGYPGPMAPHGERAFNGFCRATDRGVHRRIARARPHLRALDPDSVDRVGRGVLDDGRGSRTRRDCRLRTVRRRRTSGRHPRRPIRVQAAHSRLSRRNGGIVSPREPRAQPPHARARDRRVGVTASVYHPAGLSLLSKSVDQRGTALGYHGIGGTSGSRSARWRPRSSS